MQVVDDKKQHETILFRGCTCRFREPELIDNVCECMDKKGIQYDILSDETCCGVMLYEVNDEESGDEIVKRNIDKFNVHGVKTIITICPGCYESFTKYYSKHPEFNIKVVFGMDLFNDDDIDGTGHIIHDPCHAIERKEQVRSIVHNVPEKRANSCCGFGAGMRAGSKKLTRMMAEKTLSGDKVITYCPQCYHTLCKVNKNKTVDFYKLLSEQLD